MKNYFYFQSDKERIAALEEKIRCLSIKLENIECKLGKHEVETNADE